MASMRQARTNGARTLLYYSARTCRHLPPPGPAFQPLPPHAARSRPATRAGTYSTYVTCARPPFPARAKASRRAGRRPATTRNYSPPHPKQNARRSIQPATNRRSRPKTCTTSAQWSPGCTRGTMTRRVSGGGYRVRDRPAGLMIRKGLIAVVAKPTAALGG